MKKTVTSTLHHLLFLLVAGLVTALTISGCPFEPLFYENPAARAYFRIAISILITLKITRTWSYAPLIFGYESVFQEKGFHPKYWNGTAMVLSVFLAIGFLTDIVSVLIFLIFLSIILNSKAFSLENLYIQITLFYLPFLGTAEVYSVDAYLGIPSYLDSPFMFQSLFVTFGLSMFSAGYEKLKSPIWQSGEALKYFFKMPHYRFLTPDWVFKAPLLLQIGTYFMIAAEFLFIFSVISPYSLIVFLIVLILFSSSLLIFVDLSFIPQFLIVPLSLLLGVKLLSWNNFFYEPASLLTGEIHFVNSMTALINISVLILIMYPKFSSSLKNDLLQKYTLGFRGVLTPFNECHLFNVMPYRMTVQTHGTTYEGVMDVFNEKGSPGSNSIWNTSNLQGAMYIVTDYCLGLDRYGPDSTFNCALTQFCSQIG